MDQCLRYDENGNIYPLPFGPTKTSLYSNAPFCVNPIEMIFLILIGIILQKIFNLILTLKLRYISYI